MKDSPDEDYRVCCMCKEWRDPDELNACTVRKFEDGKWVKKPDVMCVHCQVNEVQDEIEGESENEVQDEIEGESENDLYESYQRDIDTDHRMSEARKLK